VKRGAQDETRIVEMVFPNHTNSNDQLFGGYALSLMDKLAFIVASRYARMPVVTASSDKIEFRNPVKVGDLIEFVGKISRIGRTSITVSIDMYSENLISGDQTLCTTGKFVMVAVDADGRPTPVNRSQG
jgi:acyl-CoA hydrolase